MAIPSVIGGGFLVPSPVCWGRLGWGQSTIRLRHAAQESDQGLTPPPLLTDRCRACSLEEHLRLRQLDDHKFRRQYVIGPYIVDFVCLQRRLVVEVDGGQHGQERAGYDAERTRWLQSRGHRVLRFWNNDVLRNVDGVLEVIRQTLAEVPS